MFEITMNGPGKNAMGTELMRFVLAKIHEAAGQPILLRGTGDAFSAGLDLKELSELDTGGMERFLRLLDELTEALYCYAGPTVAQVNGHAIAGGCILALCCDHRVAANNPRTKIGLNEVALGVRFPPRLWQMVCRRLPPQHLEQVLLGGALYSPEAALRLGLVDELADDVAQAAVQRLTTLASHPPSAYLPIKRALRGASIPVTAEQDRAFMQEVLPVWTSDAVRTRLLAVTKRPR